MWVDQVNGNMIELSYDMNDTGLKGFSTFHCV